MTEAESPTGGADALDFSGAEAASPWAKIVAVSVLAASAVYCLVVAGRLGFSQKVPFRTTADFALFAGFIVVTGAIERLIEPLNASFPPFGTSASAKADKTLLAASVALVVGIVVSSAFGLYFMETIGVKLGSQVGTHWVFGSAGDKWLRGLDIFVTALVITGGTKPLHDTISAIEKAKDGSG